MMSLRRNLSISQKLFAVTGLMCLLIALELLTLRFAMSTLSAVRAFAGAEGARTRAEVSALQSLRLYAITKDEDDYQTFLDFLRVPLGDRKARLELDRATSAHPEIVDGLLQGQVHLDDVKGLVAFIRRFEAVPQFASAIARWRDGDELLSRLIETAEKLHLEVLAEKKSTSIRIKILLTEIADIDRDLSFVEDEFSNQLGEASRWLERLLTAISLVTIVSVSGAGLIIMMSYARRLTRGLNELKDAARRVAGGDFSCLLTPRSRDELGELTCAINEMTLGLRTQVNERKTAEHANETKSLFLANMSHEIRTPLNAILGFSDVIARGHLSEAEREKYAAIVHRTGRSLLTIIDDILDIAKVESDQVAVSIESFSLKQMLSDLFALLNLRCEEKGITLRFEKIGGDADHIRSDPTRLRQIIGNIIGNAIKFTSEGEVTLHYGVVGAELHFDVRDSGPGIPKEKIERLFKPFSQVDDSIRKKFGGTGLGLVISRRLAQLLGGDVFLSDPQPATGAEFCIRIRYVPDVVPVIPIKAKPRSNRNERSLEGRSVLVVEDSEDNRLLANLYLSQAGAKVSFANDGQAGVDLALKEKFDVIFMDIQMPILDGYAATARLRKAGLQTPIIALTGFAMKGDQDRCLEAGCTSYLTKPIDRQRFVESILEFASPATPALRQLESRRNNVEL